ncbi:MAG: pantoate--beta-alanine ligase [Alphaproteobacteria bacterium]|nr:pantoate--beta-alanine ligase [Alphaproteobacteria bacterium]
MKHFKTIIETKKYLSRMKKEGKTIGFVPTMGALHAGHLNLIKRSKDENDLTVSSIFVNPIQFNNREDLERYPRNLGTDANLLAHEGCDVLFAPETGEMYPDGEAAGFDPEFGLLDKVMEGKFRPGHFKGVAIVVRKLFEIVGPDRAYFGKKDYQQLAIIRAMVKMLELPVLIVPCETVRESDGLAMSSRNMRLTIAERNQAPRIYKVLCKVKEKKGKVPIWELKEWAVKKIQEDSDLRVEYFEIADCDTLMPLESWNLRQQSVALTAVYLGDVRLIDNLELFS